LKSLMNFDWLLLIILHHILQLADGYHDLRMVYGIDLQDFQRPGRSITTTTSQNIELVRSVVLSRLMCICLISKLKLSFHSIQLASTTTATTKKVHSYLNTTELGRGNQFEPKSMFTVFFRSTSFVFVDCLESGKTISAKYYCDNCLKPLIQKVTELRVISRQRKTSRC